MNETRELKEIVVNGNKLDWQEGMTIDQVLKKKNYTFKMLIVKINGQLVKKTEYATTIVPQGADVKVIHLISGG
jgi:sulfur carrier protein